MSRFVVVRVGKEERRVDITGCFWCGEAEHLCAVCSAKADAVRAEMQAGLTMRDTDPPLSPADHRRAVNARIARERRDAANRCDPSEDPGR